MSGSVETARGEWVFPPIDVTQARALAGEIRLPLWLAGMLVRRGLTSPDLLDQWIHPKLLRLEDPFLLPDMDRAVDRLMVAINQRQRITIFGDYDVDGITGTALMTSVLRATGVPVSSFLPLRLEEGYGLSGEALARCLEETSPDLIITVDCGSGSVAAVQAASAAGVDVIITDHHALGDALAPAVAVVNPRRSDDPRRHVLAGVGVAFKLCHALLKRARALESPPGWSGFDPKSLLDLVALGTVADLVPLVHENRLLVIYGLKRLNQSRRPGLVALCQVAKIEKEIGTYEVGFLLGPRLNAAGRLGAALNALELLLTDDAGTAAHLASELDAANRERQAVEKAIVEEALLRVERRLAHRHAFVIVEGDPAWHPGVVGIVASKVIQRYSRPTVIIGSDDAGRAKGSGRSIIDFNLVEALSECQDLLVKFGGHTMAAGLEIAWENLDLFRNQFDEVAGRRLGNRRLVPQINVEGWVKLSELTEPAMVLLDALRPFGVGNPEPVWGCQGMEWAASPREVGKGHLKAVLRQGTTRMDAIGFGLYDLPIPDGPLDAVFAVRRESFRGKESLSLHLKDFRASPPDIPEEHR